MSDGEDKLKNVVIGGFAKVDKATEDMIRATKAISDNWQAHMDYIEIDTRLRRARYLNCIKEGFTPEQSLILCK